MSGDPECLDAYLFDLPPDRIAQAPAAERTEARLLVLDRRGSDGLRHQRVADLAELVRGDELIVLNDTRVIPARLRGRKNTGGRVELLALEPHGESAFRALGKTSKGLRTGSEIILDGGPTLVVASVDPDGSLCLALPAGLELMALLEIAGETPLPPYIGRASGPGANDIERYQTVYARRPGAVAAPTAGLHFTDGLLAALHNKGCESTAVTLHVGPGTFAPVRVRDLQNHRMHAERFEVSSDAARAITRARAEGRPILAVGTTVVRTLEAVAAQNGGAVVPVTGTTDIFIRPGFEFQVVTQLMTNFHLPGSTLLMLVSAFYGRERTLAAYAAAVADGYRFYSYGDGMLIR